jgi:hypothetical protein
MGMGAAARARIPQSKPALMSLLRMIDLVWQPNGCVLPFRRMARTGPSDKRLIRRHLLIKIVYEC